MSKESDEGGVVALKMSQCTCASVRMLARRVSQIYDQTLAPTGLTIAQYGILARLMTQSEIAIGDLAERMVTDPTTLTRNLSPLRRDGYLDIAPDPADRRRRIVAITPRGREIFRAAIPAWQTAQRHVAEALGQTGLSDLQSSLANALDRLSA